MADILIEPVKAKLVLFRQDSLERELKNLSQDVESVRIGLRYKIAAQQSISQNLRSAVEQIEREGQSTHVMRTGLEQIIARYEQTEKGNTELATTEQLTVQQIDRNGSLKEENADSTGPEFDWGSLLIKELATLVGPAGFLFTGGQKLLGGDWESALNELVKSVGKTAKVMIDKPRAEWAKNLFGLNMIDADNLPSYVKGQIGDFSTLGKGIGTTVKWGTSLIDSLIKNGKEFGENWGGRFWEETITETVLKIGEGALVSMGVGAAAVAIFGSAPAIAVGAVTVGATMLLDWGLDSLVSWATGGSQTSWIEAASDLICDTGEKIVDAVGPVVTKTVDIVKDAANAAADTVKKGWNKVKDGVSNLFSGCKWGRLFA